MEFINIKNIEQKNISPPYISESFDDTKEYQTSAVTALELGAVAMKFARINRVPRYDDEKRESDVEHSFMLALVASELAYQLYPDTLNVLLVGQYSVVHDLIELKTGDVATFQLSQDELACKEATERAALEELVGELPPYTAKLLFDYEQQTDVESRFVRTVDKLLPIIVDILGAGRRVMNEDYGVNSSSELSDSHHVLHERIAKKFKEFPQLVSDHGLLCELFELEF